MYLIKANNNTNNRNKSV